MKTKKQAEMTITVSPQIETRLRRKAAQTGQDADALAVSLLSEALDNEASEEELRAEYHSLADLEMAGPLTDTQTARLRHVEARLDDWEERRPAVQALYRRRAQDDRKLDRILAFLESLPHTH